MFLRKALAAALTGTSLIFQHAIAHSEQRNPLSRLARVEDAIIQTPSHRVHAHSEFEVTFVIHDTREQVRLTLEPNHDIFSEDATIQYLDADGNVDRIEPISRRDHKVFRGTSFVRREGESDFKSAGWARISVHQDGAEPIFDGVFSLRDNLHHVQTSTHFRRTAVAGDPEIEETDAEYMIVWRDSDLTTPAHADLRRDVGGAAGCTADQLLYNQDENNLVYRSLAEPKEERDMSPWHLSPRALFGRQDIPGGTGAGVNLANSIGKTDGCPATRKVALVGIAMDCTYTSSFSNREEARRNVIQLVSSASQLYESSFNISLAIQNMTVNDGPCPSTPSAAAPWNVGCSNNVKIQDRLNMFSQWRGQWRDTNAYWTLLTTCGTDNAVGLAWLGSVCQQGALTTRSNETTASANVVVKTSTEWLVFAHETGHTFGAVHDCNQESCSDGTVQRQQCCPLAANTCDASSRFIMNPSTGSGITRFSACTIGNVCGFLGSSNNRGQCLSNNRGLVTITGSQCGNGIVEGDEECDCGGDQGCAGNTCCDPKTCKFTANSQCDPANEECCTRQCRFMDAGAVCRASTGVCDPQEVCSGTSATCPSDTSSPDGTGCGDGLACASGQCTSRDLQCKVMMGSLSTSNDTYSCSSSGCSLSCASPSFGPRTCYTMPQYFLDGTPCEGGGRCSNGNCQGASLGQQILAWINDNKPIFIPVVIIVGLLLLAAFISCIWSCCRRRRPTHVRVPKAPPPPVWGPPPMGPPGYGPPVQGQRWEPMRSRSFRYA